MSGLITGIAVAIAAFAFVGPATASEIARPETFSIEWFRQPEGAKGGKIRAETRGGMVAGYLIVDERTVGSRDWVGIRLGMRPNDRVGWVRGDEINRLEARVKIHVSLRSRTVALFSGNQRIWRTRVVIGARRTPTPRGLFAIHDFYRVRDELRPWQIELTAHSEVLRTFEGGPGRVALHGRHGPLRVPWGTRASNGCIRSPNWALRSIRRLAPVGTPVRIR